MTQAEVPLKPVGGVSRYWGTPVTIDELPLAQIISDGLDQIGPDGVAFEVITPSSVLVDEASLKAEFLASLNSLADAQGAPPVENVELEVQVWRRGHDQPATGHPGEFVGWCFLATSPAPAHSESGALAFADPRAGSAMTAMPGLPWGRQVMIRPTPGAHAAVPGWLTTSVVPLERGQFAVVAVASSVR
ncbi:hypothetical protein [Actinomadura sp. HBU206391]|uniref:hypothetical protein n=1 Tax=Actinomadura sp. HBU206391 TaxID=2731692 RepID=UPI001650C013|nr:hypothetical protein [Actinomadura sp. HBU206391]MBC6457095.1 hypothetical protein [Actinomadura sp. HBU206391]